MFISYKKHYEEIEKESNFWNDRIKYISDLENKRFDALNAINRELAHQNTWLVKTIDYLINKYGDKFMEAKK